MKYFLFLVIPTLLIGQHLPDEWSQSYGTYDRPVTHEPGGYSFGFSINNYAFYHAGTDSQAYDTRRFDVFARVGILKNTELEFKFSYPTCGVVSAKYLIIHGITDIAGKLGFGYMKGTRAGFITDYVIDIYPTMLLSYILNDYITLYGAPKLIYSIHPRDIQEHSERASRHIFQYGSGIGIAVGKDFAVMVESNWLWGNNEGVTYIANQFGVGVNLLIR